MNPEIKKKWIEALRSGKYKQADGRLHDGEGFCCLGVLCDVLAVPRVYDEDEGNWWFGPIGHCDWEVLPEKVAMDWGIGRQGQLRADVSFGGELISTLANLNDAGADFNFIADVIEKQL